MKAFTIRTKGGNGEHQNGGGSPGLIRGKVEGSSQGNYVVECQFPGQIDPKVIQDFMKGLQDRGLAILAPGLMPHELPPSPQQIEETVKEVTRLVLGKRKANAEAEDPITTSINKSAENKIREFIHNAVKGTVPNADAKEQAEAAARLVLNVGAQKQGGLTESDKKEVRDLIYKLTVTQSNHHHHAGQIKTVKDGDFVSDGVNKATFYVAAPANIDGEERIMEIPESRLWAERDESFDRHVRFTKKIEDRIADVANSLHEPAAARSVG